MTTLQILFSITTTVLLLALMYRTARLQMEIDDLRTEVDALAEREIDHATQRLLRMEAE